LASCAAPSPRRDRLRRLAAAADITWMRVFGQRPAASPGPTRIGVIGDVHACDEPLARLLTHLRDVVRVDMLCCVGDIVNGPGNPDRCAALLAGADVLTVRGNHDRWLLDRRVFDITHRLEDLAPETVAYLQGLPAGIEFEAADGTPVLLCHGLGENDMNAITSEDYGYALEANDDLQALVRARRVRLVLKGHRHRQAVWRIGDMTLVDTGTLIEPAAPCAVVVETATRTITPLSVTAAGISTAAPHRF
jgi:predicted phosphodiesterase